MVMLTNAGPSFGTCKNCKGVIIGDVDDSQGFCTDECWEAWRCMVITVTECEKETENKD